MEINNIIFFYPSHITGGTEYLFLRCAEYLSTHQNLYTIFLVDYNNGFTRRNAQSDNINFIEYTDGQKTIIPDNSAVVVQLNMIGMYDKYLSYNHEKSIVLYWCLHTLNIKSQVWSKKIGFLISKKERKQIGIEIQYLAERNVIKYMGHVAYAYSAKDFLHTFKRLNILPNVIPFDEKAPIPSFTRINNSVIKFCWLGRLDKEKARNLETYMNELEAISTSFNLSLSIIGLGTEKDILQKKAKKYSFPITFVGEKRNNDLDEFIRNETEIGLASGTSALEFSIRGKPVIYEGVINKVYSAGKRQKYFLLSEQNDIEINQNTLEVRRKGVSDFKTKVYQIIQNYDFVSKQGYKYTLQYSAANCCERLIETILLIAHQNCFDIKQHTDRLCNLLSKGRERRKKMKRLKFIIGFGKF